MIYVLVGQTNSGKSTLARDLVTATGIKQIITYTTRPMRQGERDGIDYHFITNGEMNSGGFFGRRDFYTVYRDEPYSYAMKEDDFILLDDALIILDPKGVRELKDHIGYENITVVYINASEELIKERASKRGDKVDEVIRRLDIDRDYFISAKYFADIVLDPETDDMLNYMYDKIKGRR